MRFGLLHSPFLTPADSWGALPGVLEALHHDVLVVDADTAESPKNYARTAAEQLGGQPVVLLALGDAGMLLPLVAARREHGWVQAAVFLDASMPGRSGESWLATTRRREPAAAVEIARRLYAGDSWPDPAAPGWVGRDVHPRGLAHLTEPIPVPSAGWDFSWGYVQTSAAHERETVAAEAAGAPVLRLPMGHDPAIGAPVELAAALVGLAARLIEA